MLKIQMALIALLIGCLALTSCDLIQGLVTPEMMPEEMMPEEMMPEEMMAAYTSWLSATLETAVGTGAQAHPGSARTIYINDIGAMALQDASMTTFPAGTILVKEVMDAAGTSVVETARMEKTDMYATENGWLYNDGSSQAGCHSCHVKAGVGVAPGMDGVFTAGALIAAAAMDDGAMDDGTMDDGTMDDGTMDDGTMDDGTGRWYYGRRYYGRWYYGRRYYGRRYYGRWYYGRRYYGRRYYGRRYYGRRYYGRRYYGRWYYGRRYYGRWYYGRRSVMSTLNLKG